MTDDDFSYSQEEIDRFNALSEEEQWTEIIEAGESFNERERQRECERVPLWKIVVISATVAVFVSTMVRLLALILS